MIEKEDINAIVKDYTKDKISIGTLGSHSALNIFKGAKEEGFRTVCICRKKDEIVYRRFSSADEVILIEDFSDLLDEEIQERLRRLNVILIPHGSFNAYLSMDKILNELYLPMFGNRKLLSWEIDREKQRIWLRRAGLTIPKIFEDFDQIDRLVIAKFPGARGGKGYFLVNSPESFKAKTEKMITNGHLKREDLKRTYFQEYVVGVNAYIQYFQSTLQDEVEMLGIDKRYESAVDGIGRIPAREQLQIDLNPTYTIVGNIPITLRESLLPEIFKMGDNVVRVSKEIAPPGIIGPFCLENVITDKLDIFTFEISARIVAGSNVGIGTSPYAYLKYGERMYMGRRIAREIRLGIEKNKLEKIVY
jgi:5-formaminoimidazole-4-carboxamide-1-(beta)-D-ribofuranosyl 5'-monophosphate synthetase